MRSELLLRGRTHTSKAPEFLIARPRRLAACTSQLEPRSLADTMLVPRSLHLAATRSLRLAATRRLDACASQPRNHTQLAPRSLHHYHYHYYCYYYYYYFDHHYRYYNYCYHHYRYYNYYYDHNSYCEHMYRQFGSSPRPQGGPQARGKQCQDHCL